MCKCVVDWKPDPEVQGSHKMVPYTCEDYIADLEKMIQSLLKTQADSLRVLAELAQLRARHTAQLQWAGLAVDSAGAISADSGPE